MISNLNWEKNWAGKWTILECSEFGREYTSMLKDVYKIGPKQALFSFEKGLSSNYLVSDEIALFSKKILQGKDESELLHLVEKIYNSADEVLSHIRSSSGKVTRGHYDLLWELLDSYLTVHFPMKKIVDYLPEDSLKNLLPSLEKARVYAEPVYAESLLFISRFAENLENETNLPKELILCLLRSELDQFFDNGILPSKQELQERYDLSVIYFNNGVYNIMTGIRAREYLDTNIDNLSQSSLIKGSTAFPGIVRGVVRIVTDPKNIEILPKDSILVTGMTRPEYLPLFEKSLAVITDAGGILSHAAITARELKKPCIIGTQNATRILKDDDLVEVDADNGVVRVL